MIPTADDVARAIIWASKETGADPEAVARGDIDRVRGRHAPAERPYPISRARAYAAKALAVVFSDCWRTRIAGFVGARGLSRQSYFSALDQRIKEPAGPAWWDEAVLLRVVAVVMTGMMADSTGIHDVLLGEVPPDKPKAESVKPKTSIVKLALEYRPPAGTAAAILADDEDDGPVFDVGGVAAAGFKRRDPVRRAMTKAEMNADLRAAVQRTASLAPKEE